MSTSNEFVNDLKLQLDGLNTKIEHIEKRARTVKEESKEKLLARVKYLREKRDTALTKMQII
ncbi:MAG: hypothetical protein JW969_00775 [Spirochaetales bacterium]|nr:hypothetical protein [Spirochaetales bacterium]